MRRKSMSPLLLRTLTVLALMAAPLLLVQTSAAAETYREAVVADGPVSYWRLGESSGTTAADVTGSNPGTYQGGFALGQAGALVGDPDTSVRLTGNNGRVTVPSRSNLNFTGNFTVEAWARPDSLSGSTQVVLHKGGSGASTSQYQLSVTSNSKWRGSVYVGSNTYSVTSTANASTSAWTHVVMVRSGRTLTLYLNGQSVASRTFSGNVNTTSGTLALGRRGSSSSDYFRGGIDEAALYPQALTSSRIAAHHATGTTPPVTQPSASFTASPTSGTAPLDVAFTDTSTGGVTSWAWDFGDGATSTVRSPTHRYASPGTYTVALTVSGSGGTDTETKAGFITVTSAPGPVTAAFSATPTSGTAPLDVAFTDTSTGGPTSWAWSFGDGGTSTAQNPSHRYASPGTYTVSLTATGAGGTDTETKAGLITVTSTPPTGEGYRSTVMADSPVGYWRLGEQSGTTTKDETGAPNGTVSSGVTLGVPGALAGDTDKAMRFNGSTGYVSVSDRANLDFTNGDFSVEAWAKPTAATGMAVLQKGGTSGYATWQYRLSVSSGGLWRGTVFVGSSNITVTSSTAPSTTDWTHLVMVRSGTSLRLYVNGTQVATATFSGSVNTSTGIFAIGRTGSSSSDYFRGDIDDVAIYPSALSAARVSAHYAAGTTSGPPPGPDSEPPTAQLTSPTAGTTFTQPATVNVIANASDNVGVSRVEFYDGTSLIGSDATSPYSVPWTVTEGSNGSHTLTAKAYDAAGNSKVSSPVQVTVAISGTVAPITASVETTPVPHTGDAADDPAIWVHPTNPSLSTVIGTDKQGGLAVYGMDGQQLFYYPDGFINNVDVRYGFPLGGELVDLVVASNYDSSNSIRVYRVDPATRGLVYVAARTIGVGTDIYGFCMYHSAVDGQFYAINTTRDGRFQQWRLFDNGAGKVDASLSRAVTIGSVAEGCVADDDRGSLYVAEEDVGIWKYGAEPTAGSTRTQVDTTGSGGHVSADVEGLSIYYAANGAGYLIASSQDRDNYVVYRRDSANEYITTFAIAAGAIDGVTGTDGVDIASVPLGGGFPEGVLVVADDVNSGGNQNFKLVPWGTVARGVSPQLTIDTSVDPRSH